MKAIGKLALDTNAVIAYREGIPEVCTRIDKADIILLPVTVIGELLYGALTSTKTKNNEKFVHKFARVFSCNADRRICCCTLCPGSFRS